MDEDLVLFKYFLSFDDFSCMMTSLDQRLFIPIDQIVSILLVSNMYNGILKHFDIENYI